jgi:hypothetical protein
VEPHQGEVLHRAQSMGLVGRPVTIVEPTPAGLARAFAPAGPADILNVRSFVPPPLLRSLYAASDAVLGNAGREPFGLVGLERSPSVAEDVSREARRTARRFLWDRVVDNLISKIELLAVCQGMSVTEPPARQHVHRPRAVPATSATNGVMVGAS